MTNQILNLTSAGVSIAGVIQMMRRSEPLLGSESLVSHCHVTEPRVQHDNLPGQHYQVNIIRLTLSG